MWPGRLNKCPPNESDEESFDPEAGDLLIAINQMAGKQQEVAKRSTEDDSSGGQEMEEVEETGEARETDEPEKMKEMRTVEEVENKGELEARPDEDFAGPSEKRRRFSRQDAVSEQNPDEKLDPDYALSVDLKKVGGSSDAPQLKSEGKSDAVQEIPTELETTENPPSVLKSDSEESDFSEFLSERKDFTHIPNIVVDDIAFPGLDFSKALICDEFAAYGMQQGSIHFLSKHRRPSDFLEFIDDAGSSMPGNPTDQILKCFSKSVRRARERCARDFESAELVGHKSSVMSMTFSHRDGVLISGAYDGSIKSWSASTQKHFLDYQRHEGIVRDLLMRPREEMFASSSEDSTVRLYKVSRVDPIRIFEGDGNYVSVHKITFPVHGSLVATACSDFCTRVFGFRSGRVVHLIEKSHRSVVTSLDYSACGNYLAIACQDGTVSVWDMRTLGLLKSYEGRAPIISALFSSDDKSILSMQEDGDMIAYRLPGTGDMEGGIEYDLPLSKHHSLRPIAFTRDFHSPHLRLVRCRVR